ncbi:DUF995 domain-containing protein [Alisedimentitalea sp. MJ-SS2]|uniref:DUF995 domain-containing protein n=1 Tax=Aliisedimentitalea sp. MJ-SS2 TaxID=3049795 RepID=UPI002912831E|nr:DUF995 domain-containing protein [Alisedimentitalea sp. MJ-SS2]MDU8929823.1 DUF995 domain-containing protein [Alisedimentitalea sp. MJ-SS2]
MIRRLAVLFLLFSVPAVAVADKMPRGAQPATAQKIAQIYAGKTDMWEENCGGGIYFAPNWQARAWCQEQPENLGAGKWTVDNQGVLCQNLNWYWPNGNRAGKSKGETVCISHVVDRAGKVWRSWPGDSEWWPVDNDAGMVRGYKFQSNVRATRSKLGL